MCYPNGVPEIDLEISPALSRVFVKIDSLAKYGDSLVANAEPVINQDVLNIGYHPGGEMMPGTTASSAPRPVGTTGQTFYLQSVFNPSQGQSASTSSGFPAVPPASYYGQDNLYPTPPMDREMQPMWGYPQQQSPYFSNHFGMPEAQIHRSSDSSSRGRPSQAVPPAGSFSYGPKITAMPSNFSNEPTSANSSTSHSNSPNSKKEEKEKET